MRQPYPSDPTDQPRAIIEPLIPDHPGGRPRTIDMPEVLDATSHLNRSGRRWARLPHGPPAQGTVSSHLARWRDDGTWQRIGGALRQEVRAAEGRAPSPSAGGIESQPAQAPEVGGGRGYDGGTAGR